MKKQRVVAFYPPTKMFYDLWVNRRERAIDETDRIKPELDDLIVNQRDPEKRAVLEAELAGFNLKLDRPANQHGLWHIAKIESLPNPQHRSLHE